MAVGWSMPVSLSLAGLAHRPLRWLLLAAGVAVAAVLPVLASGLAITAQAAAVSQAVSNLPTDESTITAITSQSPDPAAADAVSGRITAELTSLSTQPVERILMYRQLSLDGSTFTLGSTNRLSDDVVLKSGRMPSSCTATKCEVIVTIPQGGSSAAEDAVPADYYAAARQLGLVVTGSAVLTDQHLFSGGLATDDQPILLGNEPDQIATLSTLVLFGRNNAWMVPLDSAKVLSIGPAAFAGRLTAFTDEMNVAVGGVTITWPQDTIDQASGRAAQSTSRFSLLGATSSVIMLGFVLVASVGLRRRHQLLVRVMRRRGASDGVIIAVPAVQVLISTVVGLAAGIGGGAIAARLVGSTVVGAPAGLAGAAIDNSWPSLAELGSACLVVALLALLWPDRTNRSVRLFADLITAAAVAGIALALSGGTAGADPGNGGSPLVESVAALVAITTGLVAARLWPLVMTAFRRAVAGLRGPGGLIVNLAILGGVRRPLRPTVTAGFAAAAVTALVFAGGYSATLRASAADQAAYQVPLDVRIGPSQTVSAPSQAVDPAAMMAAVAGATVFPVVTSSSEAFAGTQNVVSLPLIGLDSGAITSMHNFAHTTGASTSAAALAEKLAAPAATDPPGSGGPMMDSKIRTLHLAGSGGSIDYDVALWVVTGSGSEQQLPLKVVPGGFEGSPAALAAGAGPLRVVAVEVTESSYHLVHRQHDLGEGNTDKAQASGVVTLGAVTGDGRSLGWSWQGWGSDHATISATITSLRVAFQINDTRIIALPQFSPATDIPALGVAVDPQTAAEAHDGAIALTVGGLSVPGRVVAVLPRMPTFGDRYIIADRSVVTSLLDRVQPGTAYVSQIWVQVPTAEQARMQAYLKTYPVNGTTIALRVPLQQQLAGDPVTTGSETLLTFAGVLAVIMAMIALMSTVWSDRSDESGEYLAWESDGLTPRSIRGVLFVRVCSVLVVALPMGLAGGLFLAEAATVLIAIGGSGYVPEPPVQLAAGTGSTAILLVVALLVTLAGSALAAALSLRESVPPLPEVDLR